MAPEAGAAGKKTKQEERKRRRPKDKRFLQKFRLPSLFGLLTLFILSIVSYYPSSVLVYKVESLL